MHDPIHELRRKNLLAQIEKSKLLKSEFARKVDVSRSYLSQLLTEGFRFGEKAARAMEQKLRLPDGVLDREEGSPLAPVEVWERPEDLPEGVFAIVPRIAVSLSAGAGAASGEEMDLPPLAFREDWLRRKNVTSRKNLRVAEVKGDSMEDYLFDGDIVLIDTGQIDVVDREVYAILYGEELRIKRLSRRFDKGLIITSDNKRYPEESLTANEASHITILGRMLWRGG